MMMNDKPGKPNWVVDLSTERNMMNHKHGNGWPSWVLDNPCDETTTLSARSAEAAKRSESTTMVPSGNSATARMSS